MQNLNIGNYLFLIKKVITLNSSGLLFTLNPDGSAIIGYEDYNVEFFGGADYEVMYYLDKANFELLIKHLEILNKHSIKKIFNK